MENRVVSVFYGTDLLPYKNSERTTHYPVTSSTFAGSNNVNEVHFYVDQIGGTSDISWVVVSKLPNGKLGYEPISSVVADTDLNENYLVFDLSSYYTQVKGVVKLALRGYQGAITFEQVNGVYQISGDPLVEVTGTIDFAINYSPLTPKTSNMGQDEYLLFIAALNGYIPKLNGVVVLDDISNTDLNNYTNGQVFYDKATKEHYLYNGSGYSIYDMGLLKTFNVTSATTIASIRTNCFGKACVVYNSTTNKRYLISFDQLVASNMTRVVAIDLQSLDRYSTTTSFLPFSSPILYLLTDTYKDSVVLNSELYGNFYTQTQLDTYLGNKVDKTSTGSQVYATSDNGSQTTISYDTFVSGQIVRRVDENSGNIYVGTPTANNMATPKSYVDNAVSTKQDTLTAGSNITISSNVISATDTDTTYTLDASINTSTYVMTLTLTDSDGVVQTKTIDLPLETMVVSGSYDSENKKVILTLKNGETIEFSVADLVDGLATTAQLASYVPYTSATSDVDLGNYDLSATDINVSGKIKGSSSYTYGVAIPNSSSWSANQTMATQEWVTSLANNLNTARFVDDISSADLSDYSNGQLIFDKATRQYYLYNGSTYSLYDMGFVKMLYETITTTDTIASIKEKSLSNTCVLTYVNGYQYLVSFLSNAVTTINLSTLEIYSANTSQLAFTNTFASLLADTYKETLATETYVTTAVSGKQDTLVSGTNIKTINSTSIVGSGDVSLGDNVGLGYLTTAPSSPNENGLKIVVLTSEPATYYDGYLYYIVPATSVSYSVTITLTDRDWGSQIYDGQDNTGTLLYDASVDGGSGTFTVTCSTGYIYVYAAVSPSSITGSNGATSTNPSQITADGATLEIILPTNIG